MESAPICGAVPKVWTISRPLAAILLGAALVLSANLPPTHGHPSGPGHPGVVHRHAALHLARHASHPTLGDDLTVIWIGGVYLGGSPAPTDIAFRVEAVSPVDVRHGLAVAALGWVVAESPPRRVHGPPRLPPASRAPPSPTFA